MNHVRTLRQAAAFFMANVDPEYADAVAAAEAVGLARWEADPMADAVWGLIHKPTHRAAVVVYGDRHMLANKGNPDFVTTSYLDDLLTRSRESAAHSPVARPVPAKATSNVNS